MSPEPKSETRQPAERPSLTQLVASVLAAISATVAASFFGVAGTVIGAALGAVISVVGGAVYKHSLDRTRERLQIAAVESAVAQRFKLSEYPRPNAEGRRSRPAAWRNGVDTGGPVDPRPAAATRRWWSELNLKHIAMSALALFVLALGLVTGFELLSGKPIAATVTDNGGSGTTITGGRVSQQPARTTPTPTATSSQTTSPPVSSSSASPSATVTDTPTSTPTTSGAASSAPATSSAPTPTDSAQVGSTSPVPSAATS